MKNLKLLLVSISVGFICFINFERLVDMIGFISGELLKLLGSILWYLFISIHLLIPQIIILGILAYRSKPSKESFKECYDNFLSFAKQQSSEFDNNNANIVGRVGTSIIKYMLVKGIQYNTNVYFHDFGVVMLAYMILPNENVKVKKESHMFLGIFGTWIPIF